MAPIPTARPAPVRAWYCVSHFGQINRFDHAPSSLSLPGYRNEDFSLRQKSWMLK
jgi:hypothetical protein